MLSSIIIVASCTQKKKQEHKGFVLGDLHLKIPISWHEIKFQGIDSDVSGIVTAKNDTIHLDYGWHSNSFEYGFDTTVNLYPLGHKKGYDSIGYKPKNAIYSDNYQWDYAQGLYLREYYFYDTIDNRKAKLGFPKKIGNGYCLIHFPKVDNKGNKLSIYVENVDSTTQKQIYEMFRSIKFSKYKK